MSDDTISDGDRTELVALYDACVADLAYFKREQWSIANYALLAYAALVAVRDAMPHPAERLILVVVAVVVATFAAGLLKAQRENIAVRRERLKSIRGQFGTVFRAAWGAKEKLGADEEPRVPAIMLVVVISGALLTVWLLLRPLLLR
jgi:hypothetical protein